MLFRLPSNNQPDSSDRFFLSRNINHQQVRFARLADFFLYCSVFMIEMIISAALIFLGGAVGFLIGRAGRAGKSAAALNTLEARIEEQKKTFESSLEAKENAWRSIVRNTEENAKTALAEKDKTMREAIAREEKAHGEAMALLKDKFEETVARMQEEIKNLTSRMLTERQNEFREISTAGIASILDPLNQTIAGMKRAMDDNSRRQNEFSGVFSANVENLLRQSEAARLSADRLANALRRNTKIQGEWGETILTELLEGQGLTEGRHFDTQAVFSKDASLRPDVVLHLDNERDVIIDAKVSLSDYLSYLNAETEQEREAALRRHIASLENHVKELVRKDYSSLVSPPRTSIGYVIMFVPNTSALLLATNARPDLWRKAMEQNVYIADEQTLYAALKIVRLTWSRIAQNENHKEVYALANEMLDRVGKFMEKYVEIGSKLEAATKAYTQGFDKIKEGGHSIPGTCRKLIRMGAKMDKRKNVPPELLGLDETPDASPPGLPS